MNRIMEKFSSFLVWFIYGLFALFIVNILIFTITGPTVQYFPLRMCMMVVAGLLVTFLLLWLYNSKLRKPLEKIPHSTVILTLFLICLAVKLTFVFCFPIEPESDYETFYITSVDLSQGEIPSNSRYIALFPHIFGYSSFMSFFYKIFGTSYLVAPIVNAVLSSLSI